ncbi:hypothetical protein PR003_g25616 [Phytophthora rubi]|uniref:DDE Tnp4 domain-containing protein n=1 Tax=Phytophthora rubi TaxID=129364 RepID=A0A6A4CMY1_9STRA|nr:hypothetical protein PR003_g25616 [Phytophthora rubi]
MLVEEAWRVAIRSRHYLTAQCLEAPCNSAWMLLYKSDSDINFLNATSLTRPAFQQLLRRLARFYYIPKSTSRGRPPKLRYHPQALDLVMSFYVGSMKQSSLCALFGVPPSTLSRTLRSVEESLTKARDGHHFLRGGWCIIWSRHNCPGSWNDPNTSLGFRMKLLDPKYYPDTKMNVVSDSAFPCLTAMAGRILTPLKNGDIDRILPSLRSSARTLHNAITSVHQAAEWGMRSVQKVYSRLSLPLPYDPPQLRGLCLNNLFRTANFRVRTVAISQIRTTSAGEMEVPAQLSKNALLL